MEGFCFIPAENKEYRIFTSLKDISTVGMIYDSNRAQMLEDYEVGMELL